jgi:hypothetical protein
MTLVSFEELPGSLTFLKIGNKLFRPVLDDFTSALNISSFDFPLAVAHAALFFDRGDFFSQDLAGRPVFYFIFKELKQLVKKTLFLPFTGLVGMYDFSQYSKTYSSSIRKAPNHSRSIDKKRSIIR